MARAFPEMAAGVKLLNDVQQISSWIAPAALVLRIAGDSLSGFDEMTVLPVAIEHDSFTVRETVQLILWYLHGNNEIVRTDPLGHPTFKLDQPGEQLCRNVCHYWYPPFFE